LSSGPTILAIETATELCGAAVADSTGVLAEATIDSGLSHSSRIMELVGRALKDALLDLGEVDAVAVSVGPGSFTGIRIGMGAAMGLGAGAGIPVIGVPTLDAMARNQRPFDGLVCPFVDARRGEVYFSIYESCGRVTKRVEEYTVLPPAGMVAGLLDKLDADGGTALLAGPASLLRGIRGYEKSGGSLLTADPARSFPGPAPVALLGFERYDAEGPTGPDEPRPIYVRRSDAELGQSRRG
jgi:tRNA threonylcarbamoyladenosine biosynthesis protein TsaB